MIDSILAQLLELGYDVDDLLELPQLGKPYKDAVPLLANALSSEDDSAVREQILRALAVPWAKGALPAVLMEFAREPAPGDPADELTRWAAGNTIDVIWDDREFDTIRSLASQARFRSARQMLVHGLRRSKHQDAETLAIGLLSDPEVAGHAAVALGKIGTERSLPALVSLVQNGPAWPRRQATRAAALIAKRS